MKKDTKLQTNNPNEVGYIEWRYLQGMPVGNLNTILEKLNEVTPTSGVTKAYVDSQDSSVLSTATNRIDEVNTTLTTKLNAAVQEVTEVVTTLSNEIIDEAQTRSENDLSLSQQLDKEVTARQNADVTLQTEIEDKVGKDYVTASTSTVEGAETAHSIKIGETNYNLPTGEGGVIDTEMSSTSTNAVQNKVIKAYADNNFIARDTTSSNIVYGNGAYKKLKNYIINTDATRETIPIRDTDRNFKVGAPTDALHCVNLEYLNSFTPDTTRFACGETYSGTGSWEQEMNWYAPNKMSWLVLDCGKEATDGSKPFWFGDDKAYWGNDRFEYTTAFHDEIEFTWSGYFYRISYDSTTSKYRLLTKCPDKKMFVIGM